MQLRYGPYRFDANAVAVATAKETTFDARGQPSGERHTFTMQGRLVPPDSAVTTAARQAAIATKCAALEVALRRPFQDLVMARDDGGEAFALKSATSINGVRVTRGPDYPNSEGAEFVNYRTFSLVVEAEYPLATAGAAGGLLVAFRETVAFSGGGPVREFLQPVNGLPIRQVLYAATPYRAIQTGSASSLGNWPTPPLPLWLPDLQKAAEPSFESPQRGPRGLEFAVSWRYEFGSERPLLGRPNRWVGQGV